MGHRCSESREPVHAILSLSQGLVAWFVQTNTNNTKEIIATMTNNNKSKIMISHNCLSIPSISAAYANSSSISFRFVNCLSISIRIVNSSSISCRFVNGSSISCRFVNGSSIFCRFVNGSSIVRQWFVNGNLRFVNSSSI